MELRSSGRYHKSFGGSEYLDQCEVCPEVLFTVSKHVREDSKLEIDHEFLNFSKGFIPYDVSKIQSMDVSELPFQPAVRNVKAGAKGIAKYFQIRLVLDSKARDCLDVAFNWMEKHFGVHMMDSMILDWDCALRCATLDKSPGSVWRQYWKTKGEMFNTTRGIQVLHDYWSSLNSTKASVVLFGAHLKEELRAKEKVLSSSTRIFISAPAEHTLTGVRLFHDMNKRMIASHLTTFSAVGMNKYKLGWHRLQGRCSRFKNKESVDVKNFDGSIYSIILWRVAQFRFSMLSKKEQTLDNFLRIHNWYDAVINSLIILPDGSVVFKTDGMPSGVLVTSIDDTLVSFIYLVFNYIYNGGPQDYNVFMENLVAALYGDDNMYNYSDFIAPYVNGELYAQTMYLVFGLTLTGHGLKDWSQLSFLSHSFGVVGDVFVPCLSRERILCSQIVGSCEPIKSAERASAFRILAWPYKDLFQLFTKYLLHLLRTFKHIPTTLMHPEEDIKDLYLCYESSIRKFETSNKVIDTIIYDENCLPKTKGTLEEIYSATSATKTTYEEEKTTFVSTKEVSSSTF